MKKLMGNINVVVGIEKKHTYLQDAFLIENIEIKATTVSGEVIVWNGLDWDVTVEDLKDAEYGGNLDR